MHLLKLTIFSIFVSGSMQLNASPGSENLKYYFMVPSTSSNYAYKYKDYKDSALYDIYANLDYSRFRRLGAGVLLVAKCSDVKFHNDELLQLRNYVCSSEKIGSVIDIFLQYPELSVFSNKDDAAYVESVLTDYLGFLRAQDASRWSDVSAYRVLVEEVIGLLEEIDQGSMGQNEPPPV